jgi:hypothetical protein
MILQEMVGMAYVRSDDAFDARCGLWKEEWCLLIGWHWSNSWVMRVLYALEDLLVIGWLTRLHLSHECIELRHGQCLLGRLLSALKGHHMFTSAVCSVALSVK